MENIIEQLISLEKHLKWCVDNNKPQEHLDVHIEIISDIKQELAIFLELLKEYKKIQLIEQLKPKEDE